MNSDQLKHFSQELKKAREDADLTLQTMYQRTRIDIKFLEAIEENNFEIIDEVYLRAFIKSYAKTVGLNPEESIKKFDLAKAGHLFDKPAEEEKSAEDTEEKREESPKEQDKKKVVFTSENVAPPYYEGTQNKKVDPKLIILGVAVIVISVVVYFFAFGNDSGKIIVEAPDKPAATPKQTEPVERFELLAEDTSDTATPDAPNTPEIIKDSLDLKISATSRVWIRVVTDETNQFEFTLDQNENKSVKADSIFNLLIGNAGGINLELNGSPLNLVGKIGEIKNIKVDSQGIKYLRIDANRVNERN